MIELPLLKALFAEHPAGYERVAIGDPHGLARRHAEYMLELCAASTNIVGVEKLAVDGGGSTEKFVNLLAELKFALVFAAVRARVDLLRDGAFAPAAYTPDLHVRFPDGLELLVDVVRIAGGSAPLADTLRRALETNQLNYILEQCVGQRLSVPAFDWSTHQAAKELCTKVADAVADALRAVPLAARGVVRIFDSGANLSSRVELGSEARENLYDDVTGAAAPDWLGSFGFTPSPDQGPSTGGGVTSAHFIDDETLGRKFIERISTKARKRSGLPHAYAKTPFVVALQSNEPELRPTTVLSTLTGPRHWSTQAKPAPVIPRFEHARSQGWEPLLKEWRYLGVSQVRFPNYGAFGDESATSPRPTRLSNAGIATARELRRMGNAPVLIRRAAALRAWALRFELRFAPTESQRLFALTVAIGVVCGLAAVAFHFSIRFAESMLCERALHAADRHRLGHPNASARRPRCRFAAQVCRAQRPRQRRAAGQSGVCLEGGSDPPTGRARQARRLQPTDWLWGVAGP